MNTGCWMPVRFSDCLLCIIIMVINNWHNIDRVSFGKILRAHSIPDSTLAAKAMVVIKRHGVPAFCRDYILQKGIGYIYIYIYLYKILSVKLHEENQAGWYNQDRQKMWGIKCGVRERGHFSVASLLTWEGDIWADTWGSTKRQNCKQTLSPMQGLISGPKITIWDEIKSQGLTHPEPPRGP